MTLNLFSRENVLLVIAAFVAGFAIPVSNALINIGAGLMVLAVLATPAARAKLGESLREPLVIGCLIFYAAYLLGMLWTAEPGTAGLHMLGKMRPYLVAPLLFAACGTQQARQALLGGFAIGTVLSGVVSIISGLLQTPVMKGGPGDYAVFQTHTYHNTFLSLVACAIAAFWLSGHIAPRYRKWAALVFVICVIDVLFFVGGRTAQGILLLLLAALVVFWQGRRGAVIAVVGLVLLVPAIYFGSAKVREGIANAKADVTSYQQGNADTSVGNRLFFWTNAFTLFKQAPVLGHGTGSYEKQYRGLTGMYTGTLARANPHDDYLWVAVELGALGLAAFLAMLVSLGIQSMRLAPPERWVGLVLLMCYAVSTLANSFFTDNITGTGFVLLAAAVTAGPWFTRRDSAA
ncbi:O-antigen ligase family protein [Andreprevotia chitinilytica]|uniref:O-antigen ligase family protein n=1 Tax=Andreprevotia chitinilytica TaxID=396808 RepID=UPI00054D4EAB|nr:O-antigen ligase family protein [Andreprevotia chitinilytica]